MITRRKFAKLLGSIPLFGMVPGFRKPACQKVFINRFSIAGFQFYDGAGIIKDIKVGERLDAKVEPANPHDEFAVELFYGKAKLGYVPMSDNRHISRLLSSGVEPIVEVDGTNPEGPSWQAVKVSVYLKL